MSNLSLKRLARAAWKALPNSWRQRLKPLVIKATGGGAYAVPSQSIPQDSIRVADYWTRHNVTLHQRFVSRQASLDYFHWRCDQYPGYLDLMPVAGLDGKRILDYGCGPGHDLVGFAEYSKPLSIIGCDISSTSIAEAKERMRLHPQVPCELLLLPADATALPFPDASFDYIHSSGVLHHVVNLQATLAELRRLLKPGGILRVMIYNADSIWLHLYVAYVLRLRDNLIPKALSIREAFARSTDGPNCPIARCYRYEEFAAEAKQVGLNATLRGVACSLFERKLAQQSLTDAAMDMRLEREHRAFLLGLTFDTQMNPIHQGQKAGIDLVIELTRL